jgi:hypothetical protein
LGEHPAHALNDLHFARAADPAVPKRIFAVLVLPRPSNEGKVGLVETGYVMEGRGTPIVV